MNEPITVWAFKDAPDYLRNLSTNGGDEDWLAEIPPHAIFTYISWMDRYDEDVYEYNHPTKLGWKVRIKCHA